MTPAPAAAARNTKNAAESKSIVWQGELHHITQRGNYRQNVFYEDQDRIVYLKYIEENVMPGIMDCKYMFSV